MPRLNNKNYTVEELERLIYYVSIIVKEVSIKVSKTNEIDPVIEELKELVKGLQFANFEGGEEIKPKPITWNFKLEMLMSPETMEIANTIRNVMRSSEVNENIKKRFGAMVREEISRHNRSNNFFVVVIRVYWS